LKTVKQKPRPKNSVNTPAHTYAVDEKRKSLARPVLKNPYAPARQSMQGTIQSNKSKQQFQKIFRDSYVMNKSVGLFNANLAQSVVSGKSCISEQDRRLDLSMKVPLHVKSIQDKHSGRMSVENTKKKSRNTVLSTIKKSASNIDKTNDTNSDLKRAEDAVPIGSGRISVQGPHQAAHPRKTSVTSPGKQSMMNTITEKTP